MKRFPLVPLAVAAAILGICCPTSAAAQEQTCQGTARILTAIRGVDARIIDVKSCEEQKLCPDKGKKEKKKCEVLTLDPDGEGPEPTTSWCGCPGDKAPPKECATLVVPEKDTTKPDHVSCKGTCSDPKQKCCPQWVGAEERKNKGGAAGFCACKCVAPKNDECPPTGAPEATKDACN
ncbi:MAG TPA: hypothetical protein VNJ70_10160 [Thermoanaerobaculia bacterium]|nr:hypothetical protein [Thermoanaerobaculia bacterium]